MPDVRECQPGREVRFLHPYTHDTRHGHLVAAGPRWTFVWDDPGEPCLRVPTADVEPTETDDDYSGCPSRLHSKSNKGEKP